MLQLKNRGGFQTLVPRKFGYEFFDVTIGKDRFRASKVEYVFSTVAVAYMMVFHVKTGSGKEHTVSIDVPIQTGDALLRNLKKTGHIKV